MKLLLSAILLFCSYFVYSQNNSKTIQSTTPHLEHLTEIEFHVEGMNNPAAQTTVVNSINNFPGKIITWSPDIVNQTIKIGFTDEERPIDILELISGTGYKPWYINANGMKVVLTGTNKTEEWYIKP